MGETFDWFWSWSNETKLFVLAPAPSREANKFALEFKPALFNALLLLLVPLEFIKELVETFIKLCGGVPIRITNY